MHKITAIDKIKDQPYYGRYDKFKLLFRSIKKSQEYSRLKAAQDMAFFKLDKLYESN